MEPSELLHTYLDGELPETLHSTLFSMIAGDSELQREMSDQLAIRRNFDRTVFMPPSHLKAGIMARIGATTVPPVLPVPVLPLSTRILTAAAGILKTSLRPAMFMLAGAAVTAFYLTTYTYNPDADAQGNSVFSQDTEGPAADAVGKAYSSAAGSRISADGSNMGRWNRIRENARLLSDKSLYSPDFPAFAFSSLDMNMGSGAAQAAESQSSYANSMEQGLASSAGSDGNFTDLFLPGISAGALSLPMAEAPGVFAISVRGFAPYSFIDRQVIPSSNPVVNNIAVGIEYRLSPVSSIIAEAGREYVNQRFTGTENNYIVRYDQTWLAGWATIGYQHTFIQGSSIRPFTRIAAGATESGPLGRALIGVEYAITPRISLMAAVEGTTSMYSFQNQWFSTQTAGLTYGVKMNF
jgi:hypothetical protein